MPCLTLTSAVSEAGSARLQRLLTGSKLAAVATLKIVAVRVDFLSVRGSMC